MRSSLLNRKDSFEKVELSMDTTQPIQTFTFRAGDRRITHFQIETANSLTKIPFTGSPLGPIIIEQSDWEAAITFTRKGMIEISGSNIIVRFGIVGDVVCAEIMSNLNDTAEPSQTYYDTTDLSQMPANIIALVNALRVRYGLGPMRVVNLDQLLRDPSSAGPDGPFSFTRSGFADINSIRSDGVGGPLGDDSEMYNWPISHHLRFADSSKPIGGNHDNHGLGAQ